MDRCASGTAAVVLYLLVGGIRVYGTEHRCVAGDPGLTSRASRAPYARVSHLVCSWNPDLDHFWRATAPTGRGRTASRSRSVRSTPGCNLPAPNPTQIGTRIHGATMGQSKGASVRAENLKNSVCQALTDGTTRCFMAGFPAASAWWYSPPPSCRGFCPGRTSVRVYQPGPRTPTRCQAIVSSNCSNAISRLALRVEQYPCTSPRSTGSQGGAVPRLPGWCW